jgi:serine/threonine protein kinase
VDLCAACSAEPTVRHDGDTTHSVRGDRLSRSVRVGPYKVLEWLGEGGMGDVYLAEQEHPFRRRVALKVIKLGMETREVVARFEAERQALALMDHPCIAQVYDAGATAEGRPYFAMEYVAGIPITDYCDTHRLPLDARLELFLQVCGAIQHAHQKGVIHRDIKPSNVLVALLDGNPLPKVIDFGVAKATHQRLTEKTVFTQRGVLIGTPAYMSPEQAEMSGLTVDTTTDIYSLGVLLYQLLIGAPPFDPESLRRAGYAEIQRIIREEEPLRPSARLSSLHAGATEVALRRKTQLRALVRELEGDLDWITLKAMEKDRTRRYASASEFAADITRHLKTQPVIARPPSWTYRAGKFVRKYKAPLIAVAITVTTSSIVSTALLTRMVVAATSRQIIDQVALVEKVVRFHAAVAAGRNPAMSWTAAIANDEGVRGALESAIYASPISAAAICDVDGRVVAANNRAMKNCLSGPPLPELPSVNALLTVFSDVTTYAWSSPVIVDGNEVGQIRVGVSSLLMRSVFRATLFQAVISSIAQIVAVAVVAIVASWFAFRRD